MPSVANNAQVKSGFDDKDWPEIARFEAKAPNSDHETYWAWNPIFKNGKNASYSAAVLAVAKGQFPAFFVHDKYVEKAQTLPQYQEMLYESFMADWEHDPAEDLDLIQSVIDAYGSEIDQLLLGDVLKGAPDAEVFLREHAQVVAEEKFPPFLGVLTTQHSEDMKAILNKYTHDEVKTLRADFNAKPSTGAPFHLGGQPFWGVNAKGEYTSIQGYELLLRYAGLHPDKLHVTASKSLFSGMKSFKTGFKNHHQVIEDNDPIQEKNIKAADKSAACNFVLFQAYWARNLLIQGQGKITFISFNIRADEYVLTCAGRALKDILLEISEQVKTQTNQKSYIVYEATEYAKWTEEAREVLKQLRSAGVHIWIDDVLIQKKQVRLSGFGDSDAGHSTTHTVALELIEGEMASGHKFGQGLSTQLTGRGLDRFDLEGLKKRQLPPQQGPTQYKNDQREADIELRDTTKQYMQVVNKINKKLPLVIEVSATTPQLLGLVDVVGDLTKVMVQGGDSADFGVTFDDLRKLHAFV